MSSQTRASKFSRRAVKSIDKLDVVSYMVLPEVKSNNLPLLVKSNISGMSLQEWLLQNWTKIEDKLHQHGAILFRGFNIKSDDDFSALVEALPLELLSYFERSTPRQSVLGNILTSTMYPPEERIMLHNENSALQTIARKLFFYCALPSNTGGQTPLADARKVLTQLEPKIVEKFKRLGWMLTRNYTPHFGYSWMQAFNGMTKSEVEAYLTDNDIKYSWKDEDRLWTCQVRPATIVHPVIGVETWFNHIAFWHPANLSPEKRDLLLNNVGLEGLPYYTCYGDGSAIEDEVALQLLSAYEDQKILFDWQQHDVLLVDNILTCHGRESFEGERKVRVCMAQAYVRDTHI